ncbi:MAG: hypothetical protein ABIV94_05435 [Acidimicrobiales bacterium]
MPPLDLQAQAGVGRAIVTGSFMGTGLYVVVAVLATVAPDGFGALLAAVALALFAAGVAAFLWSYAIAVGRSRVDAIGIGGLYFLSGSAPRAVRLRLLGALALEVVVAVATASIRPFTALAFGVLVPVFGLGLTGLWGARHGLFPPR